MKIIKKITFFLLIICLVGCVEFFPTITPTTPTNSETILETNYLRDSENVTVTHNDYYYAFKPESYDTGIILLPDENIKPESYAMLMHQLADKGFATFILKNFQTNEKYNSDVIIKKYDNISNWYIGGHGESGPLIATYLEDNYWDYDGVFFLSSYSPIKLTKKGLKILSVYGENDLILNKNTYRENLPNFGNEYLERIIRGGNYSNFADIKTLDGDGNATISLENQVSITMNYILEMIASPDIEIPIIRKTTITYEESIETFVNPDRGFYNHAYIPCTQDGVGSVKEELLFRNSLIHLRIDLSEFSSKYNGYKDLELTDRMLESLDALFQQINDSGACVIVRFAYDNQYAGNVDMEPKIAIIQKHIEQLTPIINKHKNMISALECGLIGPWGEMHSSEMANQSVYNIIFKKYLSCLDEDINFLVRRPEFIYKYYGLTLDTLHKFDYENNRIACFNDGYLGSSSDLGTFKDREKEIAFLEKINENNPYGGEVTVPGSKYNQLSWACDEMFRTGLSYLNINWNDEVIARWQATEYKLDDPLYEGQTEFTYITNHLGYRYVCKNLRYSISDTFDFELNLKNVGFGELYKTKKCFVILKNSQNEYVFEYEYNKELKIEKSIEIDKIKSGEYNFYLVLADEFDGHAIRGIRFANTDMYDENLQANLLAKIKIE